MTIFYSAQRKFLQQENSTCIKSFSKETFPSILMILMLFPLRVFGLVDGDHTYRGTRRAFLLNFQGETSPLENEMNIVWKQILCLGWWESVSSEIVLSSDPSKVFPQKHILSSFTINILSILQICQSFEFL